MNRRDWLKLAGSCTLSGLAGCASTPTGPPLTVSPRTIRLLGSSGGSGYGIWRGGRQIAGDRTGARLGSLSLTKALASLSVVRAVGEGWLSLDSPLTDIIPEWRGHPQKSRVTVRMLVNQTAGFDPGVAALYRGSIANKGKVAISLPIIDAPGTRFRYGPASWEILGEVLHRCLASRSSRLEAHIGKTMRRIGISSPAWRKDGMGRYYLSTGVELTVRDMGKFGRTIGTLARGESKDGLRADIFLDLASPRYANPMFGAGIWWNRNTRRNDAFAVEPERVLDGVRDPSFWSRACLSKSADPGWLALVGSGGKRIYILPARDLVIARLGRSAGWNDGAFLDTITA